MGDLLINAKIEKFENGEKGIQPAIVVVTEAGEYKVITISNSKRFIVTNMLIENHSLNPKNEYIVSQ